MLTIYSRIPNFLDFMLHFFLTEKSHAKNGVRLPFEIFVESSHMCNCIHSIYEESWSGISLHYSGSFLAQTDGSQN